MQTYIVTRWGHALDPTTSAWFLVPVAGYRRGPGKRSVLTLTPGPGRMFWPSSARGTYRNPEKRIRQEARRLKRWARRAERMAAR